MTHDHRPLAATCTYALRLSDGRYVTDPAGAAAYDLDIAHLWLWPLDESHEARAERIAAVVQRYPWIGRATAIRSRA